LRGIVTNIPPVLSISSSLNAPMNDDSRRDQVIRYLDLAAYHYLNHPDRVKEFYFVLIIDTDRPPWILTRYKSPRNLVKGVTHQGLFPVNEDIGSLVSKGIGWLSWRKVKDFLTTPLPLDGGG